MSLVKNFSDVYGILSIKIHLKSALGFSGLLDLAVLFMAEIWHDVQKGSGYILRSIYSQALELYLAKNDLVYL